MMNRKKYIKQFIIGSLIVSLILTGIWFYWAMNNTPSKGEIVSKTTVKYLLEISPSIYLYKMTIKPPNTIYFDFGIILGIFSIIGGIINILLYKFFIESNSIPSEEENIDSS